MHSCYQQSPARRVLHHRRATFAYPRLILAAASTTRQNQENAEPVSPVFERAQWLSVGDEPFFALLRRQFVYLVPAKQLQLDSYPVARFLRLGLDLCERV